MVTALKHRHKVGTSAMVPTMYVVDSVRKETADTRTLALLPVDPGQDFSFDPGQFNMLYTMGKGEVPISISGNPNSSAPIIHTIRAAGAVTRALCGLKKGSTVGLRGPFGTSWPVDEAKGKDVVIVTGGIGLAPLRPAIYHILANREDYRAVYLFYGARTREDILYMRELEQWSGRFDTDVRVTVDNARPGWRGHVGVVTKLIPWVEVDLENTIAMVCGPEVMMRFSVQRLLDDGMSSDNVFVSVERNMKCGIGFCGHCQFGAEFVCKDGPVFRYSQIEGPFKVREL